jgi:uncharacterized membrane protein YwaF
MFKRKRKINDMFMFDTNNISQISILIDDIKNLLIEIYQTFMTHCLYDISVVIVI